MTPFIVIEVCQKFDGPHCNFPQGLEVAALVSAEVFVIFYHNVERHMSENSNISGSTGTQYSNCMHPVLKRLTLYLLQ
jgi:hypothetical protein